MSDQTIDRPAPARAHSAPAPRRLPAEVTARLDNSAVRQVTVRRGGRHLDARRTQAAMELRERDDVTGSARIVGYASVFDYPYEVAGGPELGGWTETIAPGAFRKSLAHGADVRLLLNHDGIPLARTRSDTMRLSDDEVGLLVDADLDLRSSMARDVTVAMGRGDLDEMSFAFEVLEDSWDATYTSRRISEVRLYDVSLVTYPASGAASAYMAEDLKQSDQGGDGDGDEGEQPVAADADVSPEAPTAEAASATGRSHGLSLSLARAQRDLVALGR